MLTQEASPPLRSNSIQNINLYNLRSPVPRDDKRSEQTKAVKKISYIRHQLTKTNYAPFHYPRKTETPVGLSRNHCRTGLFR